MDEKGATNFVLNRLKLGHNRQDIVDELSQILSAPSDLIEKFVTKVTGSSPQPVVPVETPPPVEIETHENYVESDTLDVRDFQEDSLYQESEDEIQPVLQYEEVDPDINYQGDEVEDPSDHVTDTPPKKEYTQEELTVFVLNNIKSHKRHNDIVEAVCQLTGMHWNEAQRFVARTQTQHHDQLSKSNKSIMITFSTLFVIGGGLLLIWSVLGLLDYYNAFTGQDVNTLPSDFIVLVIGAFIASIGIMAGGIFGLYRTLTNQ
jgi:hypothetical protein